MTFILLKLVGIFVPLRLSDEELEIGDHAIHGNEVYPSDVPDARRPARAGVAARRHRARGGGRGRLGRALSRRGRVLPTDAPASG